MRNVSKGKEIVSVRSERRTPSPMKSTKGEKKRRDYEIQDVK